ncbi:hypothetical protein [Yoonia litorea]|uniref:Uncharacterized protein n=1 Tax=Yoonia litorea TaxID=1123755 RepID=A0A1I6LKF0_9RHOB|nr:hypothetical protein [Yoonia litorea]SFS03954.1 hypothetical protein SAMN05444714_0620 [Yoonia litorea]
MSTEPELYFRIRENGAVVFRLDGDNRDLRISYDQIAVINTNRGDYRAHGDHELTPAEETEIQRWINDRLALLQKRESDDAARLVDQLNLATQWAQTKASDSQLDSVTDDLVQAMHDLRTVLLRKKADRISRS